MKCGLCGHRGFQFRLRCAGHVQGTEPMVPTSAVSAPPPEIGSDNDSPQSDRIASFSGLRQSGRERLRHNPVEAGRYQVQIPAKGKRFFLIVKANSLSWISAIFSPLTRRSLEGGAPKNEFPASDKSLCNTKPSYGRNPGPPDCRHNPYPQHFRKWIWPPQSGRRRSVYGC